MASVTHLWLHGGTHPHLPQKMHCLSLNNLAIQDIYLAGFRVLR